MKLHVDSTAGVIDVFPDVSRVTRDAFQEDEETRQRHPRSLRSPKGEEGRGCLPMKLNNCNNILHILFFL